MWLTSSDFLIKIFLMKKILYFYSTHKKNCYLAAGLVLSCLFMIPYFLLGGGSIVTYHDQLDGELFSYLLTAKYLFTDIRVYPEIMNGRRRCRSAGAFVRASLCCLQTFYGFYDLSVDHLSDSFSRNVSVAYAAYRSGIYLLFDCRHFYADAVLSGIRTLYTGTASVVLCGACAF